MCWTFFHLQLEATNIVIFIVFFPAGLWHRYDHPCFTQEKQNNRRQRKLSNLHSAGKWIWAFWLYSLASLLLKTIFFFFFLTTRKAEKVNMDTCIKVRPWGPKHSSKFLKNKKKDVSVMWLHDTASHRSHPLPQNVELWGYQEENWDRKPNFHFIGVTIS